MMVYVFVCLLSEFAKLFSAHPKNTQRRRRRRQHRRTTIRRGIWINQKPRSRLMCDIMCYAHEIYTSILVWVCLGLIYIVARLHASRQKFIFNSLFVHITKPLPIYIMYVRFCSNTNTHTGGRTIFSHTSTRRWTNARHCLVLPLARCVRKKTYTKTLKHTHWYDGPILTLYLFLL